MQDFWKQLHWYNVPDLETKTSSFDSNGILERIMLSVGYNINAKGKPTFVYLYNLMIPELDTIKHNSYAVDSLNTTGLEFYLYEPLSIKTLEQSSHYDNIVKVGSEIRAVELDCILQYIQRNKLTNVTVYVGDYEIEKYLGYYLQHMKIVTKDLHLSTIEPIRPMGTANPESITHKFISLNGRYTTYRHIIASYLSSLSTHLSWFYDIELPKQTEWYDITLWDETITEKLNFNLSSSFLDATDISNVNKVSPELEKFYNDSFCDVVGESRFYRPMGNISEKVLKPIFYKKPFVLAAPAKSLEYLKSLGFKTFGDFWDESYDECEDHEKRIQKILTVIDFVDNMSIDKLRIMYENMIPTLQHNFKRANEIVFPYVRDYYKMHRKIMPMRRHD